MKMKPRLWEFWRLVQRVSLVTDRVRKKPHDLTRFNAFATLALLTISSKSN